MKAGVSLHPVRELHGSEVFLKKELEAEKQVKINGTQYF